MRSRRLHAVTPPQSPTQSAEVRLLLALVDAVASNRFPEQFKSAILREENRSAGFFSPGERLAALVAPVNVEGLEVNPIELLLGWWNIVDRLEVDFHPGLANLTEQEARAWHLKAGGFDEPTIARWMEGRQRRTKQFGVSIRTVETHVYNGRRKLESLALRLRAQ